MTAAETWSPDLFQKRLSVAGVTTKVGRATAATASPPMGSLAPTDPGAHRYAQVALDKECAVMRGAAEGERNDQLNDSMWRIGRLVAGGYLDETVATSTVAAAARETGLDDSEINRTIASAMLSARENPRQVPQLNHDSIKPAFTIAPDDVADFWQAREIYSHIQQFARARRASPWAVLGVIMARATAAIDPAVVLPPLVGGEGSLNQFIALVGASGGGKGAAEAAGKAAIDLGDINQVGVGSGEGILHQYIKRDRNEPTGFAEVARNVIFSAAEVDQLAALKGRTGSTLLPMLRDAWSGAQLGFAYVDETKRLTLHTHEYRLCLTVGVQPGRASVLLDDSDGGTPQRFLWLPTADRDIPNIAPDTPPKWRAWQPPRIGKIDPFTGHHQMTVCKTASDAIDAAAVARHRGEVNALDGHSLLCRLKAAASLAILDGRLEVRDEDWELSHVVMAISDATREGIRQHLASTARETNERAAEVHALREVRADEAKRTAALQRVSARVRARIKEDGPITRGEIRRASASRDRSYVDEVVDALVAAGSVVTETVEYRGQTGVKYRIKKEA